MKASDLPSLNRSDRTAVAQLLATALSSRPINNFVRVMGAKHAHNPLSYGSGPSRFSAVISGTSPAPPFGVVYAAIDLATASYESMVRDGLDLTPARILRPASYSSRTAVNISSQSAQPLQLIDLTSGNAIRAGVPTDVIRYSDHREGQYFSEFVHTELPSVDGFLYNSRFTEEICVAVYDRALAKLVSAAPPVPLSQSILTTVLTNWNIQVR